MDYSTLKDFIDQKLSIRQISKLTNKSYTTIRYWLKQHNLKTHYKSFKEEVYINDNKPSIKRDNGNPIQKCNSCSIDLNVETGYWRKSRQLWAPNCKKCSNRKSIERWRNSKKKAVEYKGGKCERCDYNKCVDALEFHHINPEEKDKNFGNIKHKSWENQKRELDKCICVCSNCHREIHAELRLKSSMLLSQ
jgi:hypothetical protein